MADINTLLNPVPEASRRIKTSLSSPTSHPRDSSPPPTPRKKPKLAKDAAVYKRGKPKGTVNYPPFESVDEELLAQQQDFGLHPVGNIADFPRHIPYNSDKKSFLDKTARESFEGRIVTFGPISAQLLTRISVSVQFRGPGLRQNLCDDVGL